MRMVIADSCDKCPYCYSSGHSHCCLIHDKVVTLGKKCCETAEVQGTMIDEDRYDSCHPTNCKWCMYRDEHGQLSKDRAHGSYTFCAFYRQRLLEYPDGSSDKCAACIKSRDAAFMTDVPTSHVLWPVALAFVVCWLWNVNAELGLLVPIGLGLALGLLWKGILSWT